jgi:catechol 2,3-dioxygenase-like lactoylglutathione lyase family enzyme
MKRLDHVGIVVADLAAAKRFAINVLEVASELEVDLPEHP